MGQKTHPLGFRLGIIEKHKSNWYTKFSNYLEFIKEDEKIRNYLKTVSRKNSIANIIINRNSLNNQIKINIESGNPGLIIGKKGVNFNILLENIRKILPTDREVIINVSEVNKLNAALLGDYIVKKLEKRTAFRRAIRDTLQQATRIKGSNLIGIKIQVSGRLNGAEMARSEWIREGRVPLQTLSVHIDYATKEAYTIYGVLGIKIWVFKIDNNIKNYSF